MNYRRGWGKLHLLTEFAFSSSDSYWKERSTIILIVIAKRKAISLRRAILSANTKRTGIFSNLLFNQKLCFIVLIRSLELYTKLVTFA